VTLHEELERIAALAAATHADGAERVAAVLAAEPSPGRRTYLCAFERSDAGGAEQAWVALAADGSPLADRAAVREAVSIAALCELAEETAAGGDLDELRAQLVALRISEQPEGIEAAEAALDELQQVLGSPPSVASPARLDAIGAAVRDLELALGGALAPSPFAEALSGATGLVEALVGEVERGYRGPLR
jgi:hypothetical protein